MNNINFAYFGGEPLGVPVVTALKEEGLKPSLIICNPDRPAGRGHALTHPPLKMWSKSEGIDTFQPTSYQDPSVRERLKAETWDLFVVVAYNFILPKWLLALPKYGVLNIHPSLLPKLRGASPIRSAILRDEPEHVGVTVVLMDEKMDHGPILDQVTLPIADNDWPIPGPELDQTLADMGGKLLVKTITAWTNGKLSPQTQDHKAATYCGQFTKGENELKVDPFQLPAGEAGRQLWLKINAFAGIGDTYFVHNSKRVKVKKAEFASGKLRFLRVIPEGKREMDFTDYQRSAS